MRITRRLAADDPQATLVLLPSLGTSTRMWDPFLARLRRRDALDVLMLDLPGHGYADPGVPAAVDDLAAAALRELEVAKDSPVVLVGASLGGAIAIECARRAPGRIAALASFTSALRFGTPQVWAEIESAAVTAQTAACDPSSTIRGWFTPPFAAANPCVIHRLLRDLQEVEVASYVACCRALARYDAHGTVSEIEIPGIAVGAAADATIPAEEMRALAAQAPHFRYRELPGAHLAAIEDASLAARYMDALIDATVRHAGRRSNR